MAIETRPTPNRLEPAISSLLARLRRRIRAYLWVDGLAAALIALCAGFWLSLGIDWLFELPRPARAAALVLMAGVMVYVLYRFLIARLLVPLADHSMALLLERRFGQFHDSLLTAVELAEHPDHAAEFNPEMLAHTRRAATAGAADVRVSAIFNGAPLARRVSLAMVFGLAILVFVLGSRDALGVWVRRNVLLSDELWPRSTHLTVEGFGDGNRIKIARGADWPLAVKADAAVGRAIPEIVEVRYSTLDGARGRENMSREGIVLPGQADFQNYAHTFKAVLADLEFYVLGGDDRQGPYYLDVVDSPTISRMTLACEYPAYMRRGRREIPVAGLMQVPQGTEITIRAQANKPLVSVEVVDASDQAAPATHRLNIAEERGAPALDFEYKLPRLDTDQTLLFTLVDADGIRSLEAVRLALSALPDEPPQVNVQLTGIGTAITPAARLPAAGGITDDYGVARVWFDFHVDEAPAREQPFALSAGGRQELSVSDALEVKELALEPKQKFHLAVRAADSFALDGGPNVGSSQRYVLDVVTAEQLRSMLEARELMLRRRFETIVEELTDTRNLLTGIPTDAASAAPAEAEAAAAEAPPAEAEATEAERQAARNAVQAQRVLQNVERSRHETLAVAVAFDEIREEMVNNRVDTEELKTRLKDGVADPLRAIVERRFPPLEADLKKLSTELANPQAAEATKSASLAQVDTILVEMRQVLDKMLELETFNEVLDMLREIIGEQEQVTRETKDKQKEKLRELVE